MQIVRRQTKELDPFWDPALTARLRVAYQLEPDFRSRRRDALDADASFQQELEDRVERLMSSRGVAHEWGDDLKPLKALRFDIEGSVV